MYCYSGMTIGRNPYKSGGIIKLVAVKSHQPWAQRPAMPACAYPRTVRFTFTALPYPVSPSPMQQIPSKEPRWNKDLIDKKNAEPRKLDNSHTSTMYDLAETLRGPCFGDGSTVCTAKRFA